MAAVAAGSVETRMVVRAWPLIGPVLAGWTVMTAGFAVADAGGSPHRMTVDWTGTGWMTRGGSLAARSNRAASRSGGRDPVLPVSAVVTRSIRASGRVSTVVSVHEPPM